MRKYYKYIFIGLLVIIGLWLINTFVLKSALNVTLSQAMDNQKITYKVLNSDSKEVAKKVSDSKTVKFRLRPGSYNVSVVQAETETIGHSELVRFKNQKMSLSLAAQKAVDKIGNASLGCDRVLTATAYDYACAKNSPIRKQLYTPGKFTEPQPLLSGDEQLPSAAPYAKGVLAKFISQSDISYLGYLDLSTGQRTPVPVPSGVDLNSALIITDETDPGGNTRFVLVSDNKTAYTYRSITDQSQKFDLASQADIPFDHLAKDYSLIGDRLMVYVGKSQQGAEDQATADAQQSLKNSRLLDIDLSKFSDKSLALVLPEQANNDDIYAIDAQHFGLLNNHGLIIYSVNGNAVTQVANFTGVTFVEPAGHGAYFVLNNGVYYYSLQTDQATLVFRSTHLRISSIFNNGTDISFNAYVEGSKSTSLHSYLVSQTATSQPRLEDKLPYDQSSGLPVLRTDYRGNDITFQLALNSIGSDSQTGQLTYDQAEFDAAKQKVINRLKSDGYNIDKLVLHFTI